MVQKKKKNEINSLAKELNGGKKKHMTAFSYSEKQRDKVNVG